MVGKHILFFEDQHPRDTLFIEQAVYTVTGLKGTQKMFITPSYLPMKTEIKTRQQCLPGGHIAVICDNREDAMAVCAIVRKLQDDVTRLSDFATTAINSHRSRLDDQVEATPLPATRKVVTETKPLTPTQAAGHGIRIRTRPVTLGTGISTA